MVLMLTITNKGDIASSLGAPVLMNIVKNNHIESMVIIIMI